MNKSEFVAAVAARSNVSQAESRLVGEAAFAEIHDVLASGGEVSLPGFGKFSTGRRAGRTGRNPQTGAAMTIPPTTYPRFTAGATLKAAVRVGEAAAAPAPAKSSATAEAATSHDEGGTKGTKGKKKSKKK